MSHPYGYMVTVAAAIITGVAGLASAQSDASVSSPTEQPSSSETDAVRAEARDLMAALDRYSLAQREAATARARAALERYDERISGLEEQERERWNAAGKKLRTQMRGDISKLRDRRLEAAEALGRLEASSAAAWSEMKAGFVSAYRKLADATEQAAGTFMQNGSEKEADESESNN
jgi:hypothetical protein|tara:strand:+ start:32292 stop:32819 length:528 start_codon:yes stop_codon:yes gene_type:complete